MVGNDLANLNTTGYKATEIEFSDLMAEQLGDAARPGNSAWALARFGAVSEYTQGSIQTTNGPTDAAIQGNGFFVVQNQNNQTLYTRDGSFQVNSSGQLVDASGDLVQGWSATQRRRKYQWRRSVPSRYRSGPTMAATPTTTMSLALNLDCNAVHHGNPRDVFRADPGGGQRGYQPHSDRDIYQHRDQCLELRSDDSRQPM